MRNLLVLDQEILREGNNKWKSLHVQNLCHFRTCKNLFCNIGISYYGIPGAPKHHPKAAHARASTVSRRPSQCLRVETAELCHIVILWAAWWFHSLLLRPPSFQVNSLEPQLSYLLLDSIYFSSPFFGELRTH